MNAKIWPKRTLEIELGIALDAKWSRAKDELINSDMINPPELVNLKSRPGLLAGLPSCKIIVSLCSIHLLCERKDQGIHSHAHANIWLPDGMHDC